MSKSFIQRRSRLQEARIADDVAGRVQPGSGNQEFYKSDVRKRGELRVEAKFTSARQYSLKLPELQKIKGEALMGGAEDWAMQVEFVKGAGMSDKFAVIDWQTYIDMRDRIKELEGDGD